MKDTNELVQEFLNSDSCYLHINPANEYYKNSYIDGKSLVIEYSSYGETEEYRQCLLDYITFLFNYDRNKSK